MVIYVVEMDDPRLVVKSKKLRLIESYILERKIISHVLSIYAKKVHHSSRYDDNYLVEIDGHAMTNREVHYLSDRMYEVDSYITELKILRKQNKDDLTNDEIKSIKNVINQLERRKVRDHNIRACISEILEYPDMVNEYMTNLEMFQMLIKED